MSKFVTFLMMVLVLGFALAVPAQAQTCLIGGHDETTEDHTLAQWNAAAGAPHSAGTVAPGVIGQHLLITEVAWRGWNVGVLADSTEFIEVYNPCTMGVDLSNYYLSDVNGYSALPVLGTVNLAANATDFAVKFPLGSYIAPGQVIVIATQGGWYRHCTGIDADYMLFNSADKHGIVYTTSAVQMISVGVNGGGVYPTFGLLTNSSEFVWLFKWDGVCDLVCDVDLVYWGAGSGANWPSLKTALMCQDGPDLDVLPTCYLADVGNPAGLMGKGLVTPASGAGTRQRVGPEGFELMPGNGCAPLPTAVLPSTWGKIKALYH
jgi:hypothetical protein